MRIISGAFRGRRLHSPKGDKIRPTIDRVRESIFNIIAVRIPDSKVLDLFAGTGAMGLEALSRGARSCFFVDQSVQAVHLIRENVQLCAALDRSRIIHGPAGSVIQRLNSENELFDIIFMDPPYGKGYIQKTLEIIDAVAGSDSLVIAEQHIKDQSPLIPPIWKIDRERRYGDVLISFYSRSTAI